MMWANLLNSKVESKGESQHVILLSSIVILESFYILKKGKNGKHKNSKSWRTTRSFKD